MGLRVISSRFAYGISFERRLAVLDTAGFQDIPLWVLKENAQAIAFYESIGLVVEPDSEKAIVIGGATLLEIRLRKRLGG